MCWLSWYGVVKKTLLIEFDLTVEFNPIHEICVTNPSKPNSNPKHLNLLEASKMSLSYSKIEGGFCWLIQFKIST